MKYKLLIIVLLIGLCGLNPALFQTNFIYNTLNPRSSIWTGGFINAWNQTIQYSYYTNYFYSGTSQLDSGAYTASYASRYGVLQSAASQMAHTNPTAGNTVTYEFWWLSQTSLTTGQTGNILTFRTTADATICTIKEYCVTSGTSYQYRYQTSTVLVAYSPSSSLWHHFRISLNIDTDKASIWIDGTLYLNDQATTAQAAPCTEIYQTYSSVATSYWDAFDQSNYAGYFLNRNYQINNTRQSFVNYASCGISAIGSGILSPNLAFSGSLTDNVNYNFLIEDMAGNDLEILFLNSLSAIQYFTEPYKNVEILSEVNYISKWVFGAYTYYLNPFDRKEVFAPVGTYYYQIYDESTLKYNSSIIINNFWDSRSLNISIGNLENNIEIYSNYEQTTKWIFNGDSFYLASDEHRELYIDIGTYYYQIYDCMNNRLLRNQSITISTSKQYLNLTINIEISTNVDFITIWKFNDDNFTLNPFGITKFYADLGTYYYQIYDLANNLLRNTSITITFNYQLITFGIVSDNWRINNNLDSMLYVFLDDVDNFNNPNYTFYVSPHSSLDVLVLSGNYYYRIYYYIVGVEVPIYYTQSGLQKSFSNELTITTISYNIELKNMMANDLFLYIWLSNHDFNLTINAQETCYLSALYQDEETIYLYIQNEDFTETLESAEYYLSSLSVFEIDANMVFYSSSDKIVNLSLNTPIPYYDSNSNDGTWTETMVTEPGNIYYIKYRIFSNIKAGDYLYYYSGSGNGIVCFGDHIYILSTYTNAYYHSSDPVGIDKYTIKFDRDWDELYITYIRASVISVDLYLLIFNTTTMIFNNEYLIPPYSRTELLVKSGFYFIQVESNGQTYYNKYEGIDHIIPYWVGEFPQMPYLIFPNTTIVQYNDIGEITAQINLYNQRDQLLDFELFEIYVNYTLNELDFYEKLDGNMFSADENSTYSLKIYDRFENLVYYITNQVLNSSIIDVVFTVYNLKVSNHLKSISYVNITKEDNYWSEYLVQDEIVSYFLYENNYTFTYTDESNQLNAINLQINQDFYIVLNTSYHQIYFAVFSDDGLGIDPLLFRFYINNERKDFGFNYIFGSTCHLQVLDYFNVSLYDRIISTTYTEYNLYLPVYTLIIYNNYTTPMKVIIERKGIDIKFEQAFNEHVGLPYRFLANQTYQIRFYYINNTFAEEREIYLERNGQVESFGFYTEIVPATPQDILKAETNDWIMTITAIVLTVAVIGIGIVYQNKNKKKVMRTRAGYNDNRNYWRKPYEDE